MGAEHDLLCHEAHEMAKKLAGQRAVGKAEAEDWDVDGVRWMRVDGQRHGFTHARGAREKEAERLKATEDLWADIDKWLKGCFEESSTKL